eukprot:m.223690 g.223690  ORF g.223690 m.223690 type:complete len:62 (-) comp26348_c0_seq1:711-896(-)
MFVLHDYKAHSLTQSLSCNDVFKHGIGFLPRRLTSPSLSSCPPTKGAVIALHPVGILSRYT